MYPIFGHPQIPRIVTVEPLASHGALRGARAEMRGWSRTLPTSRKPLSDAEHALQLCRCCAALAARRDVPVWSQRNIQPVHRAGPLTPKLTPPVWSQPAPTVPVRGYWTPPSNSFGRRHRTARRRPRAFRSSFLAPEYFVGYPRKARTVQIVQSENVPASLSS